MERRTILLVEDNPDDELLTLRALKANRIINRVVVARDGVEALNYLIGTGTAANQPHELPAVVLLDLKLPKLNGLEVLQHLRRNDATKLLPVVILTSSKEEQDLVSGYGLGCNSYIRKPVDFAQFTEALKQIGAYWLVLNQPPPTP
jgi:two-component system response regulator